MSSLAIKTALCLITKRLAITAEFVLLVLDSLRQACRATKYTRVDNK